jgi:hypothetical protein
MNATDAKVSPAALPSMAATSHMGGAGKLGNWTAGSVGTWRSVVRTSLAA